MNKAILIGNLAKDPELRKTSSDISVCTFRIAVQRRFPNAQGVREADFFNIVTWRGLADNCARFLTKGRKCAVIGEIQNRTYDAQDGTKRYMTEIVADEVQFLSTPGQGEGGERRAAPPAPDEAPPFVSDGGFSQVDEDELPF